MATRGPDSAPFGSSGACGSAMLGRQAFWAIATLTAAYKGRPPLRLAAQPPLLRLPRVLSTEQCAELIQASKAEPEFQNSFKAIDRSNSHGLEWQQQALQQRETTFAQFDADKDGLLQESEVADFLNVGWSMPNHNHTHLLRKLKRKVDALSLADFKSFDWSGYMRRLRKQRPHLFARFSHQVWMPRHHPAARAVQARIAEALGLDLDVFPLSEPLLVVMYPQHGHYACHSDNPEDDTAFPHRYLTAEIFLNDAYEGGEVVFPFADSEAGAWRIGSKPMGSHFGVGEFTTCFRTYFGGDWDVHWGYDLDLTHGHMAHSA
ncbi:unnamed protein product [Effrenium voratum]|nr:unnamed protein product [Effrenium voratum]